MKSDSSPFCVFVIDLGQQAPAKTLAHENLSENGQTHLTARVAVAFKARDGLRAVMPELMREMTEYEWDGYAPLSIDTPMGTVSGYQAWCSAAAKFGIVFDFSPNTAVRRQAWAQLTGSALSERLLALESVDDSFKPRWLSELAQVQAPPANATLVDKLATVQAKCASTREELAKALALTVCAELEGAQIAQAVNSVSDKTGLGPLDHPETGSAGSVSSANPPRRAKTL